jgi:hypothetical protein
VIPDTSTTGFQSRHGMRGSLAWIGPLDVVDSRFIIGPATGPGRGSPPHRAGLDRSMPSAPPRPAVTTRRLVARPSRSRRSDRGRLVICKLD